MKTAVRCAAVAISLIAFAASAQAELTPWDQAKVTELAKQLETATNELFQAFRRQPAPTKGSPQRSAFFQLQQEIRHLRRESRSMSRALQRGADLEETQPSYQSMMETVRRVRLEFEPFARHGWVAHAAWPLILIATVGGAVRRRARSVEPS